MFQRNNEQAAANLSKTRMVEEKSARLVNSASGFHRLAKEKALATQKWKDYVKNLNTAAAKYDTSGDKQDLEAYEERLSEACDFLQARLEDKTRILNLKELNTRKAALIVHRQKIENAHMQKFSFLDESSTTQSPIKNDYSPSSQKVEVTYTLSPTPTPAATNLLTRVEIDESEESALSAYGKSFFSCCRPKQHSAYQPLASIQDRQHFDGTYQQTTATKRS
jgi:hypothetical protein